MGQFEVLCVGIAVADVMAKTVDTLPEWDRLGTFEHIEHHVGGCAANTAVDLVRLGVPTAVSACIARDGAGAFIRNGLTDAGVDTSGLVETDAASTSYTFVMIGSDGRRRYLHHVGANALFTDADVPADLIARARVLHIGGAFLMPAMDGEPTGRLLRLARERGVLTSLDTAYNPNVDARALLAPCLPHLDIFIPSVEEAQAITGESDPEAMLAAFGGHDFRLLGIKLGAEGCIIQTEQGPRRYPALPVNVIDASGAGDAFMAGCLYGVLQGWDIDQAARFANATAACCIQAIGCTAGVRSAAEVMALVSVA